MKEQAIDYKAGELTCKGYLVYEEAAQGKRPGVIVVHEWWGHNEHTRDAARRVAQAGFVAFAVDLYGEGRQAPDPQTASQMSSEIGGNLPLLRNRFNAARAALEQQANVDKSRIAAIGYCFGGLVVLQAARAGEDLRGVVSFHGILQTGNPAQPGEVKAKVLVLTGDADPFVPNEQVDAFEQEMKAARVDYKLVKYPGGKHGFTNPAASERGRKFNLPLEYNAELDRKSWDEAAAFLKRVTQ